MVTNHETVRQRAFESGMQVNRVRRARFSDARKGSMLSVEPRARRAFSGAVLIAVLAATMGSISPSFACVPIAKLLSLQPRSSGPPASRITVNGLGFEQSPIEIRWNALDGPRLGTAHGPNFSIKVTIPKVPDGLYTLIAVERQQNGSIGNTSSVPFGVSAHGEASASIGQDTGTTASRRHSSSPSAVALVAGGAALVLLGAAGAVLLTRWRRPRTG